QRLVPLLLQLSQRSNDLIHLIAFGMTALSLQVERIPRPRCVVYGQDGLTTRKEWAVISQRHFARVGLMTQKAAWRGTEDALEKGYILRWKVGARRFEYAIHWKGTN